MLQINFKEVKKAAGTFAKETLRQALVSQVKIPKSESVNPYRTPK